MQTPQETQIEKLSAALLEGGYNEKAPFLLPTKKVFEFDISSSPHLKTTIEAKFLYVKKGIPMMASEKYDEVTVDCLDFADIEELVGCLR